MITAQLSTFVKFLAGALLLQVVTAGLVITAVRGGQADWLAHGVVAVLVALAFALWFASIADFASRGAVSRLQEGFAREREKIRVRAEREKSRIVRDSHKRLERETVRARVRARTGTGLAFAGLIGVGAVLLFSQFVTLGLLALSAGGGALGGYLFRSRQLAGEPGPARRIDAVSAVTRSLAPRSRRHPPDSPLKVS